MNTITKAWRKSEAYALPMADEGVKLAHERYEGFKQGYIAALGRAIVKLENKHRENKHLHKFYLLAKEELQEFKQSVVEELNEI